jgi:hypothetical protein
MDRFDSPHSATAPRPTAIHHPKCAICHDHGFTGCPQSITRHGDLIGMAFANGTPCSCEEGTAFAKLQASWKNLS